MDYFSIYIIYWNNILILIVANCCGSLMIYLKHPFLESCDYVRMSAFDKRKLVSSFQVNGINLDSQWNLSFFLTRECLFNHSWHESTESIRTSHRD